MCHAMLPRPVSMSPSQAVWRLLACVPVAVMQRVKASGQVHPSGPRRVHHHPPARVFDRPDAARLQQLERVADLRYVHLQPLYLLAQECGSGC